MSVGFVFPGQGSWRAGSLEAWGGAAARRVLDEISTGLGRDVRALDHDPDVAGRTADAQPAIFAASLLAWRAAVDAGLRPTALAGHSLGEITAAAAAGALSMADAARIVGVRADAMGQACRLSPGTMAALVRLDVERVAGIVDAVDGLVLANDNAPGQAVVAGPAAAVDDAATLAREAGGRVLRIEVEGPFHSPAMLSAREPLRRIVDETAVADPEVTLVSGTSARPLRSGAAVADAVVEGVLAPVRWREVQTTLVDLGVTTLVELGPGAVLKGIAKRAVPDLDVVAVTDPQSLHDALARLTVSTV